MNRAARIALYIVGSFVILLGAAIFGCGMVIPAFVATAFLLCGALFVIAGIVIIWAGARTRNANKAKIQGAWRVSI